MTTATASRQAQRWTEPELNDGKRRPAGIAEACLHFSEAEAARLQRGMVDPPSTSSAAPVI